MKIFLFAFALFLGFLSFEATALAVADDWLDNIHNTEDPALAPPPKEYIDPSLQAEKPVRERVLDVVNYILTFVGLIAVVMMIFFGFLWLTSGGNDEQVERGKKGVIYVALGILLILFAYVLVDFFISAGTGNIPDPTGP